MTKILPKKESPKEPKADDQSLLGSLFSVRVEGLVSPLFESTQMFIRLIAQTFAVYKLLPMDYPGLRAGNVRLSLHKVFKDAWNNVHFTSEGAPQAILFLIVVSLLFVGAFTVFLFIMSFLSGTAHAAECVYEDNNSVFGPVCNDIAQQWIDFMFYSGTDKVPLLPTFEASTHAETLAPSWVTRQALASMLAFYSDAILVIAALLLFYHLVSLVIETAHTGVPMGKAPRQIWAPIRLVMAIGLLVPINGGLNSGQFIVIKTAELGSGMASHAWSVFLKRMVSDETDRVVAKPATPMSSQVSMTMMLNLACAYDYNHRIYLDIINAEKASNNAWADELRKTLIYYNDGSGIMGKGGLFLGDGLEKGFPEGVAATVNGRTGKKYSYSSSSDLTGEDTCGSFFIPDRPGITMGSSDLSQSVWDVEVAAFKDMVRHMTENAPIMYFVSNKNAYGGMAEYVSTTTINDVLATQLASSKGGIVSYHVALRDNLKTLFDKNPSRADAVVDVLEDYGWAFAGTFISTIERMQGSLNLSVDANMPSVQPPKDIGGADYEEQPSTAGADSRKARTNPVSDMRRAVSRDLEAYSKTIQSVWSMEQTETTSGGSGTVKNTAANIASTADVQCLTMMGLENTSNYQGGNVGIISGLINAGNKAMDSLVDVGLNFMDLVATTNGVWQAYSGSKCQGPKTVGDSLTRFQLGVSLSNGTEILQNLMQFGHANMNTGLRLLAYAATISLGGGALMVVGAMATFISGPIGVALAALGAMGPMAAKYLEFFASVFLLIGFSFAYLLPLIPFTRFFFAVVVWLGEVVESVIAIPVVALAHLNPDGEGFLSEQAKVAYQFCFSIFLRPIMTVFGLIVGLLIFTLAAYFLTYAFTVAVAASGGMAYNHEVLSRLVYTLLYAFMMFVCANKSFEMITHLPNGSVSWMNARSSPTPNLGAVEDMQKYEQAVTGIAIDRGVTKFAEAAQGGAAQLGKVAGAVSPAQKKSELSKGEGGGEGKT